MRVIIGGYAWLDLGAMTPRQVANVKDRLIIYPKQTSDVAAATTPAPLYLFREDLERGLLGVPRGFYLSMKGLEHQEVLDTTMGAAMGPQTSRISCEGPYVEQGKAVDALLHALHGRHGGALLQAQPAFGKTVVALEVARRLGRRTLVLVHQEFFLDQWSNRIETFLPDARVGVIQQDKCEFERTRAGGAPDFVIGLLQSLARDTGGRYPKEMYDSFGLIISDECHRVGAATWSDVIPKFRAAYRLGLTATPRRKDGAENAFFYHIAPVTYAAATATVLIKVRRIVTTASVTAIERGKYKVKADALNSAQIINQICANPERTRAIADDLVGAVKTGRKIMVVSARLEHLKAMSEMLRASLGHVPLPWTPTMDFYTGEWFTGEVWDTWSKSHRKGDPKLAARKQEDLTRAERAQVIFATQQMVLEGLDIPALDVMVFAAPISDVEQASGRVRRWCSPEPEKCERLCAWRAGRCTGKPIPIIVDVQDLQVPRLRGMARRREVFYRTIIASETT